MNTLVDVLYKVTLPARVLDKGTKLVYDTIAWTASKGGIDRFTLAKIAGYIVASEFVAASAFDITKGKHFDATTDIGIAAIDSFCLLYMATRLRGYFSKPRETLNYFDEMFLFLNRIVRLPMLVQSSLLFADIGNSPSYPYFLVGTGALSFASYGYFIDGDHSLFDKSKELARRAYKYIKSFKLRRAPQPLPKPI